MLLRVIMVFQQSPYPFHRLLQKLLGLPVPAYWHHPLLVNSRGKKLSKGAQKQNASDLRTNAMPADYWQIVEDWYQLFCADAGLVTPD